MGRPVYRCSGCDTPLERVRFGRFRATAAAQVAISAAEGPIIESAWRVGDVLDNGLAIVDAIGLTPVVIDPSDQEQVKRHSRERTIRRARVRVQEIQMALSWGEPWTAERLEELRTLQRAITALEGENDEAAKSD